MNYSHSNRGSFPSQGALSAQNQAPSAPGQQAFAPYGQPLAPTQAAQYQHAPQQTGFSTGYAMQPQQQYSGSSRPPYAPQPQYAAPQPQYTTPQPYQQLSTGQAPYGQGQQYAGYQSPTQQQPPYLPPQGQFASAQPSYAQQQPHNSPHGHPPPQPTPHVGYSLYAPPSQQEAQHPHQQQQPVPQNMAPPTYLHPQQGAPQAPPQPAHFLQPAVDPRASNDGHRHNDPQEHNACDGDENYEGSYSEASHRKWISRKDRRMNNEGLEPPSRTSISARPSSVDSRRRESKFSGYGTKLSGIDKLIEATRCKSKESKDQNDWTNV